MSALYHKLTNRLCLMPKVATSTGYVLCPRLQQSDRNVICSGYEPANQSMLYLLHAMQKQQEPIVSVCFVCNFSNISAISWYPVVLWVKRECPQTFNIKFGHPCTLKI